MTTDVLDYRITNPYTLDVGYARADEYFSSVWMMREETLFALADRCQGMNIAVHVAKSAKPDTDDLMSWANPVQFEDGVAVISLAGPLMKQASSLGGGTSTVAARKQIRNAAASKEVQAILLKIESPGGTSAGTLELANEVAAASKKKPVWAYAEDLMASAAYWVGSQAQQIFANPTAIVGSIGTYAVIRDLSGHAAQLGVKVHVIRAGEMKGAGEPGTEVTPAMLAEWKRVVDGLNAHFVDGVASGRKQAGLSRKMVEALADGRVYIGEEAVANQLIDGVQSFDKTLSQITKLVSSTSAGRSKSAMSSESGPVAATFTELKQTFPHADAAFRERCLESSMTLDKARDAYASDLQAKLSAADARIEKLEGEKATLQTELEAEKNKRPSRPGAPALADSGNPQPETSGNAVETWNAAVAAKVTGGMTKQDAVKAVAKEQPELREAYVEATQRPAKKSR
jgi:signal peptide peptidase SppA